MRMKIVSVVLAASMGLLVAGCGGGGSGSGSSGGGGEEKAIGKILPQKLAEPAAMPDEELQPSPADDAPFAENLAYELRRKTLDMARAPGKVTADCPKDVGSRSGTRVTCTTTYEGLKVVWNVSIGKKSGWSDNYVEYQAAPAKGLLTRDGVARLLYGNYRDSIDYALCNDIPAAVLVPLDTDTAYSCETVFKGKKPVGVNEKVRVTEAGPRVY